VFNTIVGAPTIGVINNAMNLLSVPYFFRLTAKGLVILVAVQPWLRLEASMSMSMVASG
jgi:ribose/xylose/arabinose/galactoside ABC-type transport system permease subunit